MNYQRIHDQIIDCAKTRTLPNEVYTESHHIVPKSMGGSNDKSNLVNLTAREHYLIHWLLYKIYRNASMAHAWNRMTTNNDTSRRYTSHTFEHARKAHGKHVTKLNRTRVMSDKTKQKIRETKLLKPREYTDDYRKFISDLHTGKTVSAETRSKISAGNKGKRRTDEQRQFIGECRKAINVPPWNKGKKMNLSEEQRQKLCEIRGTPVTIDGVTYTGILAAARALGTTKYFLQKKLKSN